MYDTSLDAWNVSWTPARELRGTYFPGLSRRPPPDSFCAASRMNSCNATSQRQLPSQDMVVDLPEFKRGGWTISSARAWSCKNHELTFLHYALARLRLLPLCQSFDHWNPTSNPPRIAPIHQFIRSSPKPPRLNRFTLLHDRPPQSSIDVDLCGKVLSQ